MLPTPATTPESMMNVLMAALRPRASRHRASPVNSSESGSTARRASSLCRAGSWVVNRRQPKRLGSLNRRQRPESSTRSKWSCTSGGSAASRMRRLPDMPRCRISVPASVSTRRYFARRPTARIRAPASLAGSERGTRQRRRHSRTRSASIRRPTSQGSMPRRVVSTSGSSGIPCGRASVAGPERKADDARLVVEAGQVVEVDGALDVLFVGDVPAEEGDFPLAAVVRVADSRAALEVAVALELFRLVDEELRFALERPVGIEKELAVVPHRDTVAGGYGRDVLRRLDEGVAVDNRAAVGVERIENRASAGAAGRDHERRVIDLGARVAEAERHHEAVGDEELAVEVEAHTGALVCVHELHEVAAAPDGRQLLVLDLVIEDGGVQADTVVRELRLEAGLDRRDRLRVCDRRRSEERDVAALDGWRAEARRETPVDVQVVVDLVQRAQVPADLVVLDVLRRRGDRRDVDGQVFFVVRVARAAGDGEGVGDVVAEVAKHRPGRVLVRQRGRRHEERVGRHLELRIEVEGACLPEKTIASLRREAELLRELVEVVDAVLGRGGERDEARESDGIGTVEGKETIRCA